MHVTWEGGRSIHRLLLNVKNHGIAVLITQRKTLKSYYQIDEKKNDNHVKFFGVILINVIVLIIKYTKTKYFNQQRS